MIKKAGMRFWRLPVFLCLSICAGAWAAEPDRIGYSTVQKAFQTLLARRDVKIEVRARWTIIEDPAGNVWTFVPLDHPAYPSLMRQRFSRTEAGAVRVDMAVLCQAEKMPCDKVMEVLRQRNRETVANMKAKEMQEELGNEPGDAPVVTPGP